VVARRGSLRGKPWERCAVLRRAVVWLHGAGRSGVSH
jgi:hypothetical protein